jgi:hypothetical protein
MPVVGIYPKDEKKSKRQNCKHYLKLVMLEIIFVRTPAQKAQNGNFSGVQMTSCLFSLL